MMKALYCLGMSSPTPEALAERWVHPDVSYELALAEGQPLPEWLPEMGEYFPHPPCDLREPLDQEELAHLAGRFRGLQQVVRPHARREQRLVRIAEGGVRQAQAIAVIEPVEDLVWRY